MKVSEYKNQRTNALDGLRGLAVIFVISSHLSLAGMNIIQGLSLAGIGKVGVWLFFTLSSFLLTSQFLSGKRNLFSIEGWRTYFIRRVLRIYPLYTFVLLAGLMFAGSEYFNVQDFNDFVLRLLLMRAKGVEWSILVEFRFYIILPVIIILLQEFPKIISSSITSQRWVVILGLISCILWADMTRPPIGLDSLRPYISTFLLGVAAAYITESFDGRLLGLSKKLKNAFDLVAMFALIIIICLTPAVYGYIIGEDIPLNYFHGRMTEISFLWSILIITSLYGAGVMRKLLGLSWLRVMGALSYGIYLWHPPIIKFVERNIGGQPLYKAIIVLVLVILISFITYYLVERPLMRISINKLAVR